MFSRPAEMVAGTVGRGNQQEQDVDVFAVQAGEIDPLLREGDRGDQPVDGRMLGVRHGDAHPDARSNPAPHA